MGLIRELRSLGEWEAETALEKIFRARAEKAEAERDVLIQRIQSLDRPYCSTSLNTAETPIPPNEHCESMGSCTLCWLAWAGQQAEKLA